jgi:NhaP-type Na+/H+ and K+/H+ antiporter
MIDQFEHLKLISFCVTLPDSINVPPCFLPSFFLLGVFILTAIANRFRLKQVSLREQFIMAYGGLRGAVSFSLVEMLLPSDIQPRQMFVTTTLVVILFTVFIQVIYFTRKFIIYSILIKCDLHLIS